MVVAGDIVHRLFGPLWRFDVKYLADAIGVRACRDQEMVKLAVSVDFKGATLTTHEVTLA